MGGPCHREIGTLGRSKLDNPDSIESGGAPHRIECLNWMDLPTGNGSNPTSPEALFDRLLRTDPTVPLLTFYDDSTGERAELSAKSLGNWVAKTHFLLLDELGLGVGEQAAVRLPVHWLAAPILLGSWFAGL